MKEQLPLPTEHAEAVLLADYLEILKTQGKILLFSHLSQETFTKNFGTKRKNKAEGVRPGVPDYIIVTPDRVLFIELKRTKKGTVSADQQQWAKALQEKTTVATVSYGFEQAKQFVDQQLKKKAVER